MVQSLRSLFLFAKKPVFWGLCISCIIVAVMDTNSQIWACNSYLGL